MEKPVSDKSLLHRRREAATPNKTLKFGVELVHTLVSMLYSFVKLRRVIKNVRGVNKVAARFLDQLDVQLLFGGELD